MQTVQPSPIARDHTLLGVCEALGEDFGFNPFYLRLPAAVLLLWNPTVIVAVYLAVGMLVATSRFLVREPRAPRAEAFEPVAVAEAAPEQEAQPELALAA